MNSSKPPIDGRRSVRSNAHIHSLRQEPSDVVEEARTNNQSGGDVYVRTGRQHKKEHRRRTSEDGGSMGRNVKAEDFVDKTERRVREEFETEGGRKTDGVTYERDTPGDYLSHGSLSRNDGHFSNVLRRDEIPTPVGGSLKREAQRLVAGNLGRAGSELSITMHASPHIEPSIVRAGSLNTVRASAQADPFRARGNELRIVRGGAGSEPYIARSVGSRHGETSEYIERVAGDNYCSSCGEEEDLNESLVTTNSSDQTATCSSSSNSIAQECWDNDIRPDGSLLYISCYYSEGSADIASYEGNEILNRIQREQFRESQPVPIPVSSILKPIENNRHENRIIKLIRKKSLSKKSSLFSGSAPKTKKLNIEIPSATVKKLKSNFIPYGDPHEVSFQLSQNMNLGRRATLSEIKLGLRIDETGDALRVVDIIPDSNIYNSKQVKINDLLLSVNDRPVSKFNINEILGSVLHINSQVRLKLQRTKSKHELAKEKNNYKSKVVMELLQGVDSAYARTDMCLVYVNANGLQYKYPADKNNLTNSFGLFLTLNNLFSNAPLYSGTSSVECDSYVVFTRDRQFKNTTASNLLLVSFPQQQFHRYELCLKLNKLLVKCLRFEFGSELDRVFDSTNFHSLNRMLSFLFNRLLGTHDDHGQPTTSGEIQLDKVSNEEYIKICKAESYTPVGPEGAESSRGKALPTAEVIESEHGRTSTSQSGNEQSRPNAGESTKRGETGMFHSDAFTFGYPRKLKLNAEMDAHINDALGELEANDTYEDDVKNFVVMGTCLYYKQYLLTSHMNEKDLQCCQSSLFCNGLLYLNGHERNIKNIILWKRVFPKSHLSENLYYNNSLKASNIYYLLVHGRNHFLLCTLLETNYFTNPNVTAGDVPPDVKLIKHAEEIVNFLISTRNMSYLNKEITLLSLNRSESIEPHASDCTESVSQSGSYQSHSTLTDEEYGGEYTKQCVSTLLPLRLAAHSVVFYFVHVSKSDGAVFSSDLRKVSQGRSSPSPHEKLVFKQFQKYVYKMERVFENYAKFKKLNSGLHSKPCRLNKSTICVKEIGFCFTVHEEKYWTLGRLYNNVNQVYLCYVNEEESVLSQNMIEVMFKLLLSFS